MQPRGGTPASKSGPILVIDDDAIALQAIADILERSGFVVHTLVSPIGATQVIASQGIAAAVIDLNMPVMRGDRFIALVRSWDRIRDLPIVLVSGESQESIKEAVAHLPGVAVVTKAQMNELLVPTLRRSLGVRVDTTSRSLPVSSPTPASKTPDILTGSGGPRSLPRLARTTQAAWQTFITGRGAPVHQLPPALTALQAESRQLGMTNVAELLALTQHMIEQSSPAKPVPSEAEAAIGELLELVAGSSSDKARSLDRSLALTLLRSRLDRIRQMPR